MLWGTKLSTCDVMRPLLLPNSTKVSTRAEQVNSRQPQRRYGRGSAARRPARLCRLRIRCGREDSPQEPRVMVRPVLMAVDDEPVALRALEGELGKRYGADYEVVCSDTPEVGLRRLERLW